MTPKAILATALTCAFALSITGSRTAQADDWHPGSLGGRVFAVQSEVVFSTDPYFPVGTEFDNCMYYNEDGAFLDPFWLDPEDPAPGHWYQHTEGPIISFTATVADQSLTPGWVLIQNGTVFPGFRGHKVGILVYVTVLDISAAPTPVYKVVLRGSEVESCPYF